MICNKIDFLQNVLGGSESKNIKIMGTEVFLNGEIFPNVAHELWAIDVFLCLLQFFVG